MIRSVWSTYMHWRPWRRDRRWSDSSCDTFCPDQSMCSRFGPSCAAGSLESGRPLRRSVRRISRRHCSREIFKQIRFRDTGCFRVSNNNNIYSIVSRQFNKYPVPPYFGNTHQFILCTLFIEWHNEADDRTQHNHASHPTLYSRPSVFNARHDWCGISTIYCVVIGIARWPFIRFSVS